MANDLRFIETLDHSDFDKGIAESTASIKKLSEDAALASKGIKGMFDTPAMKEAAANFQGVEKAVQRFTQAMSRDLPMKQELRQTQQAATELEQIWRNLSDAEKQSAAGQEMRQKIDMLIQRGGQLKDVMADVQRSMQFQASDTATLTATVQGIQALTAAAQVATGAMNALGMSNEDAAEAQKKLMAILSVVNGLQTIQNLLQKESALMMGLAAAKTSVLNTVTAAKVAMSKADTVATKGAAAAQVLFNNAVKANPIGALITVVAAATAAIVEFSNKTSEAAKTQEQLNNAYKEQAASIAENITKLEMLRTQYNALTSDKEKEQWVRDNADAFKSLGFEIGNTVDAEKILVSNTQDVIAALTMRAEAAALAAMAQQKMQEAIEKREEAVHRRANPTPEDYAKSFIPGEDFADVEGIARKAADRLEKEADQAMAEGKNFAGQAARLQARAAELAKGVGVSAPKTTPKATPKAGAATTKTEKPATEGTAAWYNEQIAKLKQLQEQTATTSEEFQKFQSQIDELTRQRDFKFGDWRVGLTFDKEDLVTQINSSLEKLSSKIKPMRIPMTYDDGIAAAKAKSEALLKQTEGLRLAANAAAGAFRNVGNAIGGMAGQAVNVAGLVAQAIATIITGYATATAQAASMGPWAWIAFALAGLAEVGAIVGNIKSMAAFAQGGIVGGNSYTGDRQLIRVNSGEMVLNGAQQARLWSMINGGSNGGGEVTFRIQGQQLVGVLNNYNGKMGKVR